MGCRVEGFRVWGVGFNVVEELQGFRGFRALGFSFELSPVKA